MEYCPGGELFHILKQIRQFTESQVIHYFAQIVEAFSYLHSKGIVYRDLKVFWMSNFQPENLLIDEEGCIKLIDFGLCKKSDFKEDLSYSFCGSEMYLSPEMVLRSGHNYMLDIYTLGILVYELVSGACPYDPTIRTKKVSERVVQSTITFPNFFSLDLIDLLTQMLQKNPEKRLCFDGDISQLMEHQWVSPIVNLKKKGFKVTPEYIPEIKSMNFQTKKKTDIGKFYLKLIGKFLTYFESFLLIKFNRGQ